MIVSVLVLAFIVIAIYVGSHRLSGLQTVSVVVFFVAGVAIVVFPTFAGILAQRLGVGRGVDLILYFSVVGGLFVAANFYFRIKSQEDVIVTLAREIALMMPREQPAPGAERADAAPQADRGYAPPPSPPA
jgi:hypothetical protein